MIKHFRQLTFVLTFMLLILAPTPTIHAGEDTEGLVLWNGLGSDAEVLNSIVGPNLEYYTGGYPWPHVIGDREYVPGYNGNAVTLKGSYGYWERVHNLLLTDLNSFLDPEKGSIELWYYYTEVPTAYSHNPHRLLGGAYGLGAGIGFQTYDWKPGGSPALELVFYLVCGGSGCYARYPMAGIPKNEWVHLAASWDRLGIDGTTDSIRLYVNNTMVAAITKNDWGTTFGPMVDICGGNGHNLIGKYKMDELKIWNYAKTNFFVIDAVIEIHPGKINLMSKGEWITCYAELPGDYPVETIDIDTVAIAKINGSPIEPIYKEGPAHIGDYDLDDIQDLMVKFDRQELISIFNDMAVEDKEEIELTIIGKLEGGESFEGSCTIKVIAKFK